jgi:uncharacterized protein (TIRG00374 family)
MRWFRVLSLLFLLGGLVLLGLMVWQVGLSGLVGSFQLMGLWIAPYVLLKAIPTLLHTVAWAACFPGRQRPLRLWQLFLTARAGSAINNVTPTATIGGEVVKILLLAPTIRREQAMAVVIIDKASTTLAKMFYLSLGMLYLTHRLLLPAELQLILNVTVGLLLLGLVGFVAFQRYGMLSKLMQWLSRLRIGARLFARLSQPLLSLDTFLVTYYTQHPWRFFRSLLLHTSAYCFQILKVYILLRLLLGINAVTLTDACVVAIAVSALDQLFFFVPGRLGTLEGARFLVLSALGMDQVYGLAFGIITRVEQLTWNGFGLLAYAAYTRLSRSRPLPPEPRRSSRTPEPAQRVSRRLRHAILETSRDGKR